MQYHLHRGFSKFSAGIPLYVIYHIQCTTSNYFMYSHTVLRATLSPFLCTAVIKKIIIALFLRKSRVLAPFGLQVGADVDADMLPPQPLRFKSYISPLFPCLVTSSPGDRDRMFLRNVSISLQIHTAPKPKTSTRKR
jgi:hypothetical protein